MIKNSDRQSLREFYEKTHPTKKIVKEAYLDAKTEFSEPHAIQNLKGEKVLGIQVGGKTYYMTAEVGRKYIGAMQKVIDNLGSADEGGEYEGEEEGEPAIGQQFQVDDEEAQRNPGIMGEGVLREAYTKVTTELAYNEQGKSLKVHFINLDNNMTKLLKSKFGKYYDDMSDIIHI